MERTDVVVRLNRAKVAGRVVGCLVSDDSSLGGVDLKWPCRVAGDGGVGGEGDVAAGDEGDLDSAGTAARAQVGSRGGGCGDRYAVE